MIKIAVINIKVILFSNANDALGISKEDKFAIVHTMSAVNANIAASDISNTVLSFSSVRLLTTSLFELLYFLLSIPNLHRKLIGITHNIL